MFTLDRVVPWGRSFGEYRRMFALSDTDLAGRILGCADGPASFNAEATRGGGRVVSVDPLYRGTVDEIGRRIADTTPQILEQTRQNAHAFVWNDIRSVEELGMLRAGAMRDFLEDFDGGKRVGRYVDAELPVLPFPDRSFQLAVCSHFLFLYTEQLGERFHRQAVRELLRVAAEVRIFPLVTLSGRTSPYVEAVQDDIRGIGHLEIVRVPYEFQRGGNEMMRIQSAPCDMSISSQGRLAS